MSSENDLISRKLEYLDETKNLMKQALIEKGQAVSEDDTFREYVDKILDIQTGGTGTETEDATATADDIIAPQTAYVKGEKIIGQIIPERSTSVPAMEPNIFNYSTTLDDINLGEFLAIKKTSASTITIYNISETEIVDTLCTISNTTLELTTIFKVTFGKITSDEIHIWIKSYSGTTNYMTMARYSRTGNYIAHYTINMGWTGDAAEYGTGSALVCNPYVDYDLCFYVNPTVTNGGKCNICLFNYKEGDTSITRIFNQQVSGHTNVYYTNPSLTRASWTQDGYASCIYVCGSDVNNIVVKPNDDLYSSFTLLVSGIPSATKFALRRDRFIQNDKIYTSASGGNLIATLNHNIKSYRECFVFGTLLGIIASNMSYVYDIETGNLLTQIEGPTNVININDFAILKSSGTTYRFFGERLSDVFLSLLRNGIRYIDTKDADASASNVLQNKTAYVKGSKLIGTMANNGGATFTPTESEQVMPTGYYSGAKVLATDITTLSDYEICNNLMDTLLNGVEAYPGLFVEYIQTNADGQYINTGYTHKSNTKVVLDVIVYQTSTRSYQALFGARNASYSKNSFNLFTRFDENYVVAYSRSGAETTGSNFIYNSRITLTCSGKVATWSNGTNTYSVTTTGTVDNGTNSMYIFDLNTGSGSANANDSSWCRARLYSFKIFEDDVLIKDLRPFKHTNGKLGVWDMVSSTFISCSGSGTVDFG